MDSAANPVLLKHLAHMRVSLADAGDCDIYYDAGRYEVEATADGLAVRCKGVPNGQLFDLWAQAKHFMIRKPLLLGLPIYHSSNARSFVTSTHVKLLRAYGLRIQEDRGALPEYFLYRCVTPPRTLFQGVSALPIGGEVRASFDGGKIAVKPATWTDAFRKSTTLYHLEESAARIKEDLEHTIQSLQPHRDNVTCLMDGGLNSTILFKICRNHLSLRESHSAGCLFEGGEHDDERKHSEAAAAALGSEHTHHTFTPQEIMQGVIKAIDHAEVPVVEMQSALLELVFNRALPDDKRIVVSDKGAHSIFGQSMTYHFQETRRVMKPVLAPLFNMFANKLSRFPQGDHESSWMGLHAFSKRRWDLDFGHIDHGLWLMEGAADKDWIKSTFGVDDEDMIEGRRAAIGKFRLDNVFDAFTVLDFVSDVAYAQDVWGKLVEAHRGWISFPFNSPELIRVANHTPWEERMSQHKRLIRRAGQMAGVPDSLVLRPKGSPGISDRDWTPLGSVIESLFRVAAPVVDMNVLRGFLGDDERRTMTGWALVNYAIWKRMVIDDEPAERLLAELAEA